MAEHGKTKDVTVDQLRPGMKVHQPIIGVEGKELVGAGEVLTGLHCDKLKKYESLPKPPGKAVEHKPGEVKKREEWQGGWRPSHFNPTVRISNTLGDPDEFPAVEKNIELSPGYQNREQNPRSSFAAPDTGVESPLFRRRELQAEINVLETTITELGGAVPETKSKLALTEEIEARRDELLAVKKDVIEALKNKKEDAKRPKSARK